MARRYSRREFLTDAAFALSSSLLLKVVAPENAEAEATATKNLAKPFILAKRDVFAQAAE